MIESSGIRGRRRWLRHAVLLVGGYCSALLALLVTSEPILGGDSPLPETHPGAWLSSVELVRAPRAAASERRPQRPVVEAPPRVYLGEPPRPRRVSDDAVVLYPPREPLSEYLPTVKVAPQYPREAALACIEGWVLLEFTVTNRGAVRDPIVIESSHADVFDRAAMEAVRKFRYIPKTYNGSAVEVRGVRHLIPFRLPVDACPYADSSPSSRRANRARMIPASNSTQVGSASSSCDTTSGGVRSMPTMKQTTMM